MASDPRASADGPERGSSAARSLVHQRDSAAKPFGHKLTHPMRDLLWTVAQHKYGWTHVSRHRGQLQVAEGLIRRGLVRKSETHNWRWQPIIVATGAGKVEIARRWPVSPFALGTYDHQPGGWTPVEGVNRDA